MALAVLAGVTLAGLALRLAVPRGLWLDEAISVHQANLSFHDMFENLQFGDRHPPLHHVTLWLTVRAFGDGELAVRLPSLIAGTLVIPALYLLGRELYDRRTGLVAAAFGAASPLLIWYAQEARMYAFVTLFGLLALWTQLRAIRNPSWVNWAAYILATAALLWSHYFGLLLIGVQQLIWVGVIIHRRRTGEPVRAIALGFAYSLAVLAIQLVPLITFAQKQFDSTEAAFGSRRHLRRALLLRRRLEHGVGALGLPPGRDHRAAGRRLAAAAAPLAAPARARRVAPDDHPRGRRDLPDRDSDVVALYDRELFEVRYFLVAIPLLFLLIARLVTGWIRSPAARLAVTGVIVGTLLVGLYDQQINDDNPACTTSAAPSRRSRRSRAAVPAAVRAQGHAVRPRLLRARAAQAPVA